MKSNFVEKWLFFSKSPILSESFFMCMLTLFKVSLIFDDVFTLSDCWQMYLVVAVIFAYSAGKLPLNYTRAISHSQFSGVLGTNTFDLLNDSVSGGVLAV